MMTSESPKAHGKWSQPGVPHKGWYCVEMRDLHEEEAEYQICEMCEKQTIRYVHVMEHPSYPNQLECGCDCAGYMEGNLKRAESRDRELKNRATRRGKFPNLKGWKTSQRGNAYISKDGLHAVVTKNRNGYGVGVKHVGELEHTFGRKRFSTEREARLAAFDAMEWKSKKAD